MRRRFSNKQILVLIILLAVAFNVLSFCVAYPEITTPHSQNLERDFSAYYIGAYRLFHNPTQIYAEATQPDDYPLPLQAQPFKYTPSFLLVMAPFLALDYLSALTVFDFLQIALIPLLAFFVYKLVKDKNVVLGSIAAFIVLIQPLPTPSMNVPWEPPVDLWLFHINSQSFSPSYYCGYVYINAHVLQAILLVGALYLGYTKKPWASALLFSFGLLDPRAAIVTFPLLLWYNREKIRPFIVATTVFVVATNLPFFLYSDIGLTFLRTNLNGYVITQSYAYDWIPIYAAIALTAVEIATIVLNNQKTTNLGSKLRSLL